MRGLIDRRIQDDPAEEEARLIRQALVPTEQAAEIKNGKKVTVERKKYPGYVLVEMVLNQDTIHRINGIQGVIKFVGQGWTPQPLRSDEVNRLLGIKEEVDDREPEEDIPFIVGQVVEIMEGPFSDFSGTVEKVIPDKGKVCVSVSLFGRPTTVELAPRSTVPPLPRGKVGARGSTPALWENHGSKEKNDRLRKAAREGWPGQSCPSCRHRVGPARSQHHGLLQAV